MDTFRAMGHQLFSHLARVARALSNGTSRSTRQSVAGVACTTTALMWGALLVSVLFSACLDDVVSPQNGHDSLLARAPLWTPRYGGSAKGTPTVLGGVTITWDATGAATVYIPGDSIAIGTDGTLEILADGTLSLTPPSDVVEAETIEFAYEFTDDAGQLVTRSGTVATTVASVPATPNTPILLTFSYVPGAGSGGTIFSPNSMIYVSPNGFVRGNAGGNPAITPPDDFHSGGSLQYTLKNWGSGATRGDVVVRTGCTAIAPGQPSTGLCEFDFGDASDGPYPTLLASDGARHLIRTSLFLGAAVDGESDGQPNGIDASGDDSQGSEPDDEDGVTLTSGLVVGANATADVVASGTGILNAWIDFNDNGVWENGGPEQIATDVALGAGTNSLTFAVPGGAVPGRQFARFRVNAGGGLLPTGEASEGEVEDYRVSVLPQLALTAVVTGLASPVYLTSPPNDLRLFIVELPGRIRIVQNGQLLETPFLDVSALVNDAYGMYSVAFAPDYATSGHFYVAYLDNAGDLQIVRFTVTTDPNIADATSAKPILTVPDQFDQHHGGQISFGLDGMLYIGLGDGGNDGDQANNGQNLQSLPGSLLRIDVTTGDPYGIPPGNPFVNDPNALDEIWAYGLRQPWRYAFDAGGETVYIADVGENLVEEVNVEPATAAGLNYGWRLMEGSECFNPANCDPTGLTLPAVEYGHAEGCSVTGGYVYRGSAIPAVQGHYFYSDFCSGWLRSFRYVNGQATERIEWAIPSPGAVVSFGEDSAGELYVLVMSGSVFRLTESP